MKTIAFKIFASCVAIVCLASSPVTIAAPALKLVSGTSENPIVQRQGIKDKNLIELNFVDLKPHHSRLIPNEVVQKPAMAVHERTVSQKLLRQRRTYDPEVENRLRKELEGETSGASVYSNEAVRELPDPSNEVQDSQQSNEVQNSQSNEVQNSQSNEVQDSQQSNEVQNSQLDEDYQESDDVYKYRKLPEHDNSNESYEGEGSDGSGEDSNGSSSTNDDEEESNTTRPTPLLRTTT